jgi:hypothetical protein
MEQDTANWSPPPMRTAPAVGSRVGTLVIVGTGIKAIGQFTLESKAYLQWADAVFYCVSDPATERWIQEQHSGAIDLYTLYDNDKDRRKTYVQMAEMMLQAMRQGLNVVGVFYGHPGVFVNPSHRAISIARQEGHAAFLLPAVSSLDCLFADVGVDPAVAGCQIVEATDLLLRQRPLLTDSHVILLQVGSVGDMGFQFSGFPNDHFDMLVSYLQDSYGSDYQIVHYIASHYSFANPVVEHVALADLLTPETRRSITGISTFYLPPRSVRPTVPSVATTFNLPLPDEARRTLPTAAALYGGYGRRELEDIAELRDHQVPLDYKRSRPSPAMYEVVKDLALSPAALERHRENPEGSLNRWPTLSAVERTAVLSEHYGLVRSAMQRPASDVAARFVHSAVRDARLAHRYYALITLAQADGEVGRRKAIAGLNELGYDVTPDEIAKAFVHLSASDMSIWESEYDIALARGARALLIVSPSGVLLDGAILRDYTFRASRLTWNTAAGNLSSGELVFALAMPTVDESRVASAYLGPSCSGRIWKAADDEPDRDNAVGRIAVYSVPDAQDARSADPVGLWAGAYETALLASDGTWSPGPRVRLREADGGSGVAVEVEGEEMKRCWYANGNLSWAQADGKYSGSVTLFTDATGKAARFAGRIWRYSNDPGQLAANAAGERVEQ